MTDVDLEFCQNYDNLPEPEQSEQPDYFNSNSHATTTSQVQGQVKTQNHEIPQIFMNLDSVSSTDKKDQDLENQEKIQKLTSHLAQVQFKLDQLLALEYDEQTDEKKDDNQQAQIKKQLADIAEYIKESSVENNNVKKDDKIPQSSSEKSKSYSFLSNFFKTQSKPEKNNDNNIEKNNHNQATQKSDKKITNQNSSEINDSQDVLDVVINKKEVVSRTNSEQTESTITYKSTASNNDLSEDVYREEIESRAEPATVSEEFLLIKTVEREKLIDDFKQSLKNFLCASDDSLIEQNLLHLKNPKSNLSNSKNVTTKNNPKNQDYISMPTSIHSQFHLIFAKVLIHGMKPHLLAPDKVKNWADILDMEITKNGINLKSKRRKSFENSLQKLRAISGGRNDEAIEKTGPLGSTKLTFCGIGDGAKKLKTENQQTNDQKAIDEIGQKLGGSIKLTKAQFEAQLTKIEHMKFDYRSLNNSFDAVPVFSEIESSLQNEDMNEKEERRFLTLGGDNKNNRTSKKISSGDKPPQIVIRNSKIARKSLIVADESTNQNQVVKKSDSSNFYTASPLSLVKMPLNFLYNSTSCVKLFSGGSKFDQSSITPKINYRGYTKLERNNLNNIKEKEKAMKLMLKNDSSLMEELNFNNYGSHHLMNNPIDILSRAWLVLCYYYNLIDGYEFLTNPKFTSNIAYQYNLKSLPIECNFLREFYQIIDSHHKGSTQNTIDGQMNGNSAYMFTSVVLQMRQKKKLKVFVDLVLKQMVQAQFYEDWACAIEENSSLTETLKN